MKESLQGLRNLQYLWLRDCPITDSDIVHLRQLTGLAVINLTNTKVTEAGVAELRDGMPNTVIY